MPLLKDEYVSLKEAATKITYLFVASCLSVSSMNMMQRHTQHVNISDVQTLQELWSCPS